MKCLSLLQPWASLFVAGAKRIETRSWGTSYRGRLAVHASKAFKSGEKLIAMAEPFRSALSAIGCGHPEEVPLGAVLGWVTLVDCLPMTSQQLHGCGTGLEIDADDERLTDNERAFGNYAPGRFAWIASSGRFVLAEPIPARGSLGLWELPAGIAIALESP